MSKEPYAEKRLQLAAIAWLTEHRNYQETFCDVEATGARMDSVGLLAGRSIAIEVKPTISSGMVWFRTDGSGSIEAKIAATLHALAAGPPAWLSAFASHWEPASYPSITILAGRYTEGGLAELRAMLEARSREWQFAFELLRWTGSLVETLDGNQEEVCGRRRDVGIAVPLLVGRAVRASARSLDDLRSVAAEFGLADTFDVLLAEAMRLRLGIQRRRTGFGLKDRTGALRLSVFVVGSDAAGLNVGLDAGWLGLHLIDLPGREAPRNGYMNTNRLIGTPDEGTRLMELVERRVST